MTTIAEPAVLFRLPDEIARNFPFPSNVRDFVLLDDPEDTQAVNEGYRIRELLDAEAGSLLRFRLSQAGDVRRNTLRRAERLAAVAEQLQQALVSLNERWSGGKRSAS